LYEVVEATATSKDGKAQAVNRFLVSAEGRYIQYLALVDSFISEVGASKESVDNLNDVIPLPPWSLTKQSLANSRDVAIIFHAHCLSPFRFYTDMLHRTRAQYSNLWAKGIAFPLERLHGLISNGVWSDEQSESIWDSMYASRYQLWEADATSGAELHLQGVAFSCPWCSNPGNPAVDLNQFTETHISKTPISACPSCGCKFNAANLSAIYLKEDLNLFIGVQDPW
jgi:hypothetical protein